jgi:hypothetical protein
MCQGFHSIDGELCFAVVSVIRFLLKGKDICKAGIRDFCIVWAALFVEFKTMDLFKFIMNCTD